MPASVRVIDVAETGSTNADALRLALAGEPLPLWLRADRQTAGRGRAGRSWIAAEGALMASLALRLDCAPVVAAQLSLVAGVAATDAIRASLGEARSARVQLKWPNDLMLEGAKAGGILIETARAADGLLAIVGFGVNLAEAPTTLDRPCASLAMLGVTLQPAEFLSFLVSATARRLAEWDQGRGFPSIRAAWVARAMPVGAPVAVERGSGRETGTFAGLDEEGAMLFASDAGGIVRVTFGDVTILAAPPRAAEDGGRG